MPDTLVKDELPAVLKAIDLAGIDAAAPRELVLNPAMVTSDVTAAGRALVYARSSDQTSYDAIGFRTFAASPRKGPSPLQTSAWSAIQQDLIDHQKRDTLVDEILHQQTKLRHRPLALPSEGEKYRFAIDRSAIHLIRSKSDSAGRTLEDQWTFSLMDPPAMLLQGTFDRDEPMIAAQHMQVDLQGTHWLPLPVLLEDGCFGRFQEVRSRLVRVTGPGSFYCFLSHRWLDPVHPDPASQQARFTAWQLIAYLAEAVRVADQRGLHQPRRFSAQIGVAVGPHASELAESLIVNVLRTSLDEERLQQAAAEALSLESELEDYGVAKASTDSGLKALNGLLAGCPILRGLLAHIFLWYDYSCLPQPPREGDDLDLFVKGLEELSAAQIIGRTAIMLDDADDYLSRAWCTLEALVADTFGGVTDLLVGSARPSAAEGYVEHHFDTLLQDRPHVVWRAILDTELFGIQSTETCMQRLGLDVTDPNDLPFIYKRLSALTAPAKTHIDDSEIVTGTLPLPAFENGTVALCARQAGRSVFPSANPASRATLDWTQSLSLAKAWNRAEDSVEISPSFIRPPKDAADEIHSCHLAVVGACEGEAIMLANWVRRNKAQLESLISVPVRSLSWVASDIAPIGHMVAGVLEVVPVMADRWVVVATSTRLQHCKVTGFILESLKWSGIPYSTVAIDRSKNNVEISEPTELPEGADIQQLLVTINLIEHPPKTYPGGLFQWQFQEEIVG